VTYKHYFFIAFHHFQPQNLINKSTSGINHCKEKQERWWTEAVSKIYTRSNMRNYKSINLFLLWNWFICSEYGFNVGLYSWLMLITNWHKKLDDCCWYGCSKEGKRDELSTKDTLVNGSIIKDITSWDIFHALFYLKNKTNCDLLRSKDQIFSYYIFIEYITASSSVI